MSRIRDPGHLDPLTRRDLLAGAARALLGVGVLGLLPSALHADDPARTPSALPRRTARRLIQITLAGGMSHLDTLDPKPGAPTQGPLRAIPTTVDGVLLGEHLPRLAQRLDRCALIRSLTSTQGAHEPGQYLQRTSFQSRGTIRHPTLGAWMSHLGGRLNPTLPAGVVVNGGGQHPGAGFLATRHAPLAIGNPTAGLQHARAPAGVDAARLDARLALKRELDAVFTARMDTAQARAQRDGYDEALALMRSRDLAAFDLAQEPEEVRAAYGEAQLGQGCLLARRLVEHDVRSVEVVMGGWDTHDDHFDRLPELAGTLDTALAALLDDLERRGLLDETLVAVTTEFGRTPRINKNDGRDHHPKAFSVLLAGGGVPGGRVWGATDELGETVARDPVTFPDLNATIGWALGLPLEQVVHSPDGRPFTLADKGRPVLGLFA